MKRYLISALAVLLGLLGCNQNTSNVSDLSSESSFKEDLNAEFLFTGLDLENATFVSPISSISREITVGDTFSDSSMSYLDVNDVALSTQVTTTNLDGLVCNISHDPNSYFKWGLYRHILSNTGVEKTGLFGVQEASRSIQSVDCRQDGTRAVFSMIHPGGSDHEIFVVDEFGTPMFFTNDDYEQIDVTMSADGTVVAWNAQVDGKGLIVIWKWNLDGSVTETVLNGLVGYFEPSLSNNGQWITFIDNQPDRTNVYRHKLSDGIETDSTTGAVTAIADIVVSNPGRISLRHPSISDSGHTVGWMQGSDLESFRVKNVPSGGITELVSDPNLDHAQIASLNSAIYSLKDTTHSGTKVVNFADAQIRNVVIPVELPAVYLGANWTSYTAPALPTPILTLSVSQVSALETVGSVQFTIERSGDSSTQVIVSLNSSDSAELTVPNTVTIPAGSASVNFNATVLNDNLTDGNKDVTVSASASDHISGTTNFTVLDVPPPPPTSPTSNIIVDFESGNPEGFGPYADSFDGSGSLTTVALEEVMSQLPKMPSNAANTVASVNYNIATSGSWGGGPGYGGISHGFTTTQDWSGYDGFTFWFHGGNTGLTFQAEIFDNGTGAADAERFDYNFTDDFTGWKLFEIPFSAFSRATDFNPDAAPNDGLGLTQMWGYAFVLAPGAGNLMLDDIGLYRTPQVITDFESGVPEGFGPYADAWDGSGSSTTMVFSTNMLPIPYSPSTADNTVATVNYNIATSGSWGGGPGYGGLSHGFTSAQDWSGYTGFSFWFKGSNSGLTLQSEIFDNGPDVANSERFDYNFVDNFNGWKLFEVPFADYTRATDFQPDGAPNDGLGLTEMWGYAFVLAPGAGTADIDNIRLYAPSGDVAVSFEESSYEVAEGGQATVTIALSRAATSVATVQYSSAAATADASDFMAASGSLTFAVGEIQKSFIILTLQDTLEEGDETLTLTLSNPTGATLGGNSEVTLTILDDDYSVPTDLVVIDPFESSLATGTDADGVQLGFVTFNDPNSTVGINTSSSPPMMVPTLAANNQVLKLDLNVASFAGFVHNFEDAAATTWTPQNWSAYEGIGFWLYGQNSGTTMFIDILDNRNAASTSDDAERFSASFADNFSGWRFLKFPFADLIRKDIGNGAPNDGFGATEIHGWALGTLGTGGDQVYYIDQVGLYGTAPIQPLTVSFTASRFDIAENSAGTVSVKLSRPLNDTDPSTVSVNYTTEDGTALSTRDYTATSGVLSFNFAGPSEQNFPLTLLDDAKYEGNERIVLRLSNPQNVAPGLFMQSSAFILEDDAYDSNLIDDFERGAYLWETAASTTPGVAQINAGDALALPGQGVVESVLNVESEVGRDFAIGQDWSSASELSFWAYGSGSGQPITVELKDNKAVDAGPTSWGLVWSDEFNEAAGTPPSSENWSHEIGDVTPDGKNGWGNDELQYYTDDPANASTDGQGNLVITAKAADGALQCYYGTCEYTSARLISSHKAEFAYGKIEARIQVPQGAGLWPAFWSLGTDIDRVSWPQTGEIDFMEFVGRLPNEIYGTIHGPGYAGGQSFGKSYDFGAPVYTDFHTFTVEWQPDLIKWYVDGILYHTATPADVAPNDWVFNDPVFMLLNVAVGGNFGGAVGADTTFPQSMKVDYVRVYQAPDSAERFETSFVDSVSGWQQVTLPLSSFSRSATQPVGAPNDGLNLNNVSGYGFKPMGETVFIDQIRLQ